MEGRTRAGWWTVGVLSVAWIAAVASGVFAQAVTYAGVTFPNGDLAFADRVVAYVSASCVREAYADPEAALGPPDAGPGCVGCVGCHPNAVSLGFRLSDIDDRGYLILEYVDNVLIDTAGDDLFVYITNERPARVEISVDGLRWIFVGQATGYPAQIDIGPYVATGEEFRFVRLSDVPADEGHSTCPGPSIDAVGAMGPSRQTVVGEAFGSLELQPIGDLAIAFAEPANNVLIILDSSSSMADAIDGATKIEVAKNVIVDLIDNLPTNMLVGMRVFGGCGISRLISPVTSLEREVLKGEVRRIQPGGATPIAYTLEQAKTDFAQIPDAKMILLVSDGMETCGGDPVAAARDLIRAGYDLRIHVVGFDIEANSQARDQLIAIAESTGGVYYDARSSEELRRALTLTAPFTYTVYDEEGAAVFSGRLGEAGPQLSAGVYRVVIDTTPPLVVTGVVVEDRETTRILVERIDGSFKAEVGS